MRGDPFIDTQTSVLLQGLPRRGWHLRSIGCCELRVAAEYRLVHWVARIHSICRQRWRVGILEVDRTGAEGGAT